MTSLMRKTDELELPRDVGIISDITGQLKRTVCFCDVIDIYIRCMYSPQFGIMDYGFVF
ncbi:hypothetical protein [Bacillus sp. NPDC093026]|uniref:hypothetical protein n=1 Tax=Bacillus sp. NPDC093026 TaxID=3363948 RepID=UPI003827911A